MKPWLHQRATFTATLLAALVAGCNTAPPKWDIPPSFATNITSGGIKFFTYTLKKPEREERLRATAGRNPGLQRTPSSKQRKRDKNKLTDKVDLFLAENGYCREGYFILDQYIGPAETVLRGECKEGATEQDRMRFSPPNAGS